MPVFDPAVFDEAVFDAAAAGGSNPTIIMGTAAIWYGDIAQPGAAPNADGSGTLVDGGPLRFLPGLAGPNAATTDNAREAIYRAGGGDPYIEGDAGSQLRASLSRAAGDFYAIMRVQFRGTGTQFDQPFTIATDTNTFYNGTAWADVKLNPFLSPVDARFEVGTGTEPASQDAPRDTWHTIEIYATATLQGLAINGAAFVTGARSAAFPATGYIDLFNSVDGGSISPGVPTWFRRGAVTNAIPDSTQRAALLTWATDGDPGGGSPTYDDARTETAATGDAQTSILTATAAITETAATGHAQTATVVGSAAITETAATGDVSDATVPGGVAITEAAATGDAQTSILTATAAITETAATGHVQATTQVSGAAVAESAATGHTQVTTQTAVGAITETAATGHTQIATVVGSAAITETAATGHVQAAAPAVGDTITETAATGHAQVGALVRIGAAAETAATGHLQATTQIAVGAVSESAATGDACAAVVIRSASVIEVVTAADQVSGGLSINAALTEVVAANDTYLLDFTPPSVFLRRGKATRTESALTTQTRGRYGATETSTVMQ